MRDSHIKGVCCTIYEHAVYDPFRCHFCERARFFVGGSLLVEKEEALFEHRVRETFFSSPAKLTFLLNFLDRFCQRRRRRLRLRVLALGRVFSLLAYSTAQYTV